MSVLSLVGACLQILKSQEDFIGVRSAKGNIKELEKSNFLFFFLYKVVIAVSLVCPRLLTSPCTISPCSVWGECTAAASEHDFSVGGPQAWTQLWCVDKSCECSWSWRKKYHKVYHKGPWTFWYWHSGIQVLVLCNWLGVSIHLSIHSSIHPSSITAYLAHRVSHLRMLFFSAMKYVIYLFIYFCYGCNTSHPILSLLLLGILSAILIICPSVICVLVFWWVII